MPYDGKDVRRLTESGVSSWNLWRAEHPGMWPDLVRADLHGMDLRGVNFFTADLRSADLSKCDLEAANFSGSVMLWTNLAGANLQHATFNLTNMNGAILNGANLSFATMMQTILVDVDFRDAQGLQTIAHLGRSHIDIDTIIRSQGSIPLGFLTAIGMSEASVKQIEAFTVSPPVYYSCFISYSTIDNVFVQRLYNDLRENGVRCWLAAEDMKTGTKVRASLDEAIREHDKVLLVLSETSVRSQWVEQEVETALERERREDHLVLFPVRIDDHVFSIPEGWVSLIKNSRHIGDFRNWQDRAAYSKALSRLLRDLRSSSSSPLV